MTQPINYILQHPVLKEEAVKLNVDLKYQRSFLQGYSKDIPREAAVVFSANEINIKLKAIRAIRGLLYNYYQLVLSEIPNTSSDSRPEIEEDHEWDSVSVEKPGLYGDNPLPMGITVGQYMNLIGETQIFMEKRKLMVPTFKTYLYRAICIIDDALFRIVQQVVQHNGRPSFGIPEYLLAFREEQDKTAAKKRRRGRKRAGEKEKSIENKRKKTEMMDSWQLPKEQSVAAIGTVDPYPGKNSQ